MKTLIFSGAIAKRNKITFWYSGESVEIIPFSISVNKNGKKILYGKHIKSNVLRMFEYNKICNIRVVEDVTNNKIGNFAISVN